MMLQLDIRHLRFHASHRCYSTAVTVVAIEALKLETNLVS